MKRDIMLPLTWNQAKRLEILLAGCVAASENEGFNRVFSQVLRRIDKAFGKANRGSNND